MTLPSGLADAVRRAKVGAVIATSYRDLPQSTDDDELALASAIALTEEALGPDHPRLAGMLFDLALVHAEADEHVQALELLERAVALFDRLDGDQLGGLAARFALASALVRSGGDRVRARALAEQARDGWRSAGAGSAEDLAAVEAWLAAQGDR